VALLENGLLSAVVVAIAITVLVKIEGHLLQPFIMSRSVKVHPLAVLLGVVAGTTLGGIPGAFIAVPLIAFVNTSVRALRNSPSGPEPAPSPRAAEKQRGPTTDETG
jgi:predicted PurR-regulated permease PerM